MLSFYRCIPGLDTQPREIPKAPLTERCQSALAAHFPSACPCPLQPCDYTAITHIHPDRETAQLHFSALLLCTSGCEGPLQALSPLGRGYREQATRQATQMHSLQWEKAPTQPRLLLTHLHQPGHRPCSSRWSVQMAASQDTAPRHSACPRHRRHSGLLRKAMCLIISN